MSRNFRVFLNSKNSISVSSRRKTENQIELIKVRKDSDMMKKPDVIETNKIRQNQNCTTTALLAV